MAKRPTREKSVLLTEKQAKYVDARASGLSQKDAMTVAGFKPHESEASNLQKVPKITAALMAERAKNAYMLGLTREKVLEGMMEAIDQAKLLADPMSQIAGWREIAKICGFYAPEVKKIELSGKAKTILERLEQMDDQELLRLAEGEVIDGEFTVEEARH